MNMLLAALMTSAGLTSAPTAADAGYDAAVASYEHLATVIIEVRATEDQIVKSILHYHHHAAAEHLAAAAAGKDAAQHVERAADEISNIANEGDKRVLAIRQRLSKAGHTHISDADTKEDYMFVNSKEKKGLLELARKVAQLGKAKPADIEQAGKDLDALFAKAIAPEK